MPDLVEAADSQSDLSPSTAVSSRPVLPPPTLVQSRIKRSDCCPLSNMVVIWKRDMILTKRTLKRVRDLVHRKVGLPRIWLSHSVNHAC